MSSSWLVTVTCSTVAVPAVAGGEAAASGEEAGLGDAEAFGEATGFLDAVALADAVGFGDAIWLGDDVGFGVERASWAVAMSRTRNSAIAMIRILFIES